MIRVRISRWSGGALGNHQGDGDKRIIGHPLGAIGPVQHALFSIRQESECDYERRGEEAGS